MNTKLNGKINVTVKVNGVVKAETVNKTYKGNFEMPDELNTVCDSHILKLDNDEISFEIDYDNIEVEMDGFNAIIKEGMRILSKKIR